MTERTGPAVLKASSRARRLRALSFATLVVGGLLGVISAAQPWWRVVSGPSTIDFTGTTTSGGLAQAIALVVLAGTLLSLALRVRGRRVVGVLLVGAAAGMVVLALLRSAPSRQAVLDRLRLTTLSNDYVLHAQAWPWIYAFGGVAVLAGGALMTLTAGAWPQRADRFERTAKLAAVTAESDPTMLWKALDAGLDPTADSSEHDLRQEPPSSGRSEGGGSGPH